MEEVVKQTKESPVLQKAIDNPRPTIYGIGFFLIAIWILARSLQLLQRSRTGLVRPSTPDLEKERVPARSFKAPQRPPGGMKPILLDLLSRVLILTFGSMDTHGFQKTNCTSSTKLGCPHHKTKPIPTVQVRPIPHYNGIEKHELGQLDWYIPYPNFITQI